jgi:hypothetical protein
VLVHEVAAGQALALDVGAARVRRAAQQDRALARVAQVGSIESKPMKGDSVTASAA